jgi:hypothetical protein
MSSFCFFCPSFFFAFCPRLTKEMRYDLVISKERDMHDSKWDIGMLYVFEMCTSKGDHLSKTWCLFVFHVCK